MRQPPSHDPLIFALSESRALGLAAAERAGLPLGTLEERQYEGGEFKLRPLQPVRDRTVFVVQSLSETREAPIAHRLVRLLFLLQVMQDAGAFRTVAVAPYLAYARKDRRTKPRDPVYTRYVAQLIESTGAARVITLDAHNASALDNAFRIPVDHLTALPMMAARLTRDLQGSRLAVASPDIGGIRRAQIFRELLERKTGTDVELAFIEKRREGNVLSGGTIVGNVSGRTVIVLDDLCASGTTLSRAATAMREAGAESVHVAVTHAPLEAGLANLSASDDIAQIIVTDSVGHAPSARQKVKVLPAGELIGCALERMIRGEPLAPLAEHWPPPG